MLLEIRVKNLAVIRDLSLDLGPGLNVLTGETGAGKSIVVGALGLLLGGRASAEGIRSGADRAVIEGVFDLSSAPEVRERVAEMGFDLEEGELLLLRREIQAEGRSRAWIGGSPATAGALAELGQALVDFHGQHEHQTLLRPADQKDILDAFAGAGEESRAIARLHSELTGLQASAEERDARLREISGRADFLRFQLGEIEEAELSEGDDERVAEELGRLEHAEELARGSGQVYDLLYGAEGSSSERIAEARDLLARLARFDPSLEALRDQSDELYHRAAELGRSIERYGSGVEVSPRRADELRARADLLFRLKRKYGPELSHVIEHGRRTGQELSQLDGAAFDEKALAAKVAAAERALRERAEALSKQRADGATRLAAAVEALLPSLGMAGAQFRIALDPVEPPGAGGAEQVRFLASLNAGFEPKPLARIASGGELSRVMLALKSILACQDRVPTLVFDEIDAGIGGTVAVAVAAQLREVASRHQVFVVTHLPQIAARGAHHFVVEKREEGGETVTSVRTLGGRERVQEVARMLGGDPESETSRDHAKELLATSSTVQ
ncbi:MAG: DNA repair protein RecN [Gemmatimonadota bacterium]